MATVEVFPRSDGSRLANPEGHGGTDAGIVLEKVTKKFKIEEVEVYALRELDLLIEPDQVTVILGPSGSGKTTLLNMIGGIDSPTSGRIIVQGREVQSLGERDLTRYRQESIGFVFQFFNLIPNLTARENIELVLEYVMDLPGAEVGAIAEDLLAKVGLRDRADHFPSQLSGGEQQRVAIARALAKRPTILLADEPTGELDYRTAKMIAGLLTSLAGEGRSVVIVTHNQALAKIAHKVVHLKDGAVARVENNITPANASDLEW